MEHCQLFCRAAPFHEESIGLTTNVSLPATKRYDLDKCMHGRALLCPSPLFMTSKTERELEKIEVFGILNTTRVSEWE